MLARDGFEAPTLDRHWSLSGGSADISVDSDISCGPEYRSLRIRVSGGCATLTNPSLTWSDDERLLIDIDVFLKSDHFHTQITPSSSTTGSDDVGLTLFTADRERPIVELRTRGGTWQHGSGGRLHNSKQPVSFDAWHHCQVACDPRSKTYRVLVQVIGEPPRELCRGSIENRSAADAALRLELSCLRAQPRGDGPAFDNVVVTRATSDVE